MATSTAAPSNTSTPSEPSSPALAAPAKAPGPPPPGSFSIPAWTPQNPGEADPRDATYWAQLAKLKFDSEQNYREIGEAQGRADLDYADATRTALRNRLGQQRNLGESAIRGNLGASGWLNRNEAEQTAEYTQARQHAALTKEQEDHARAAAKAALEQGWSLEAASVLAEAAGRFAAAAEGQAADGELEMAPAAAPSAGGGKKPKPKPKKGPNGIALANAVAAKKPKGKGKK